MSDVRALLDDAALGGTHPDPVSAVRARVRRRANRRRATLAAGATVAVAAGVVALPDRGPSTVVAPQASASATHVAASPKAPSTPPDVTWRRPLEVGATTDYPVQYARLVELVESHQRVFLTATVQGDDSDLGWTVAVSLGGDADPEAWRAKVAAAAGEMPWTFVRCRETTLHYDLVAGEVAAATWPSGATLVKGKALPHAVTYTPGCVVAADLTNGGATAADLAYARERWGDDVRVSAKTAP